MKRVVLCAALTLMMLLTASAATWQEMRENGAVSDGGIPLGDVRDGIVSDVSDPKGDGVIGDIITDASDAIDNGLQDLTGTDHNGVQNGTDQNGTDGITSNYPPETTSVPQTTTPMTSNTNNSAADGETNGGMTAGIIIAVLVVAAVIIVIFLLIPKRKG